MAAEIQALLDKSVICESSVEPDQFVSNVFLREKKNSGKFRMIFNLTKLNDFVTYNKFKMETLDTALKMITPGAAMASLDFTDAYYTLPVHLDHQKYLKFRFQGKLYQFLALPMGLSSACRFFTKILKVPLSILREHANITITGYIDDTLLVQRSPSDCSLAVNLAYDLFTNLGFTVNDANSVLTPTTTIEYLGFIIDSRAMTVTPTVEKVEKIRKAVLQLHKKPHTTIRRVAQVTGSLMATHAGNPWAPLFTRQLEIEKISALQRNQFDFDAPMTISHRIQTDLKWWLNNLDSLQANILDKDPDLVIFTDASLMGYGFYVPSSNTMAGSRWSPSEASFHINVLEIMAIENALKSYCSPFNNVHIRIMSDNTTAIASINKQGSTRSWECNDAGHRIWLWALNRNMWLSAAHIPGIENVEADLASREFKDELEWTLKTTIFDHIVQLFGMPQMDLFASRLNYKVRPFCAFQPDPLANTIDAFTITWHGFLGYAFPPFCLLGRIIQKIIQDRAEIILIAPDWPTKPWYTFLRALSIAPPYHFSVTNDTLSLPHRLPQNQSIHPLAGRLRLTAWRLSGTHFN